MHHLVIDSRKKSTEILFLPPQQRYHVPEAGVGKYTYTTHNLSVTVSYSGETIEKETGRDRRSASLHSMYNNSYSTT